MDIKCLLIKEKEKEKDFHSIYGIYDDIIKCENFTTIMIIKN